MTSLQKASLEEIRSLAAHLCRDYLTGRWKKITTDDIIVKRISGGLSNLLYYVSLPNSDNGNELLAHDNSIAAENHDDDQLHMHTDECNSLTSCIDEHLPTLALSEPREVLLRIYGQAHGEDALGSIITESVVFALLSERNFGPKLYGIFPGGRLEQYIPARALVTKELFIPSISTKIAQKMAEIHNLNIPMSKKPSWLWACMERWMKTKTNILSRTDWPGNEELVEVVRQFDFRAEADWLKSVIKQGSYTVLFCHNDLQEGNILLCTANSKNGSENNNPATSSLEDITDLDLKIIDFEYCAYNYRGFDLANHFLEWTFDYSNPEFPNYYHRKHQYPNKDQREKFIVAYLTKLNEHLVDYVLTEEELESVQNEVMIFSMFSHLFWSLWSVMSVTSNIEFGYWNYAVTRIQEYKLWKEHCKDIYESATPK